MQSSIGAIVFKHRRELNLTQDAYGGRYGVSGPAIFKFEKGFVRPSLALWMRIADDARLPRPWAVRVWLRESLPSRYRDYVELHGAWNTEAKTRGTKPASSRPDYAAGADRGQLLHLAAGDAAFPSALLDFLRDDDLWALYHPTGPEIRQLLEIFAPLGNGSKDLYRQALIALRLFCD